MHKHRTYGIYRLLMFALCLAAAKAYGQDSPVLARVYFPTNSSDIRLVSEADRAVLAGLRKDQSIRLVGRCDRHGDFALNDSLSVARALAVREFLLGSGFPAGGIQSITGLGKRFPLDMGAKSEDSINRVVWIVAIPTPPPTPAPASIAVRHYSLTDSIYSVYPPSRWSSYPGRSVWHAGDTLSIDTLLQQTRDSLLITRHIYIASDTVALCLSCPPHEIPFDTKRKALTKIILDTLGACAPGERIILRPLDWEFGYHALPVSDTPCLNALVVALRQMPYVKLRIMAHDCCEARGDSAFDQQTGHFDLSRNRAAMVYNYLLAAGIPSSRLSYIGVGMAMPLKFPEAGKKDQYLNRRIELVVMEK